MVNDKTDAAFSGMNTIGREEIVNSLIHISGIDSNIDKNLRIVCLKILRKVVELEVKGTTAPACEWDAADWSLYRPQVKQQQEILIKLGVVDLICNLIAFEPKLSIKEESLRVAAAILLGGNLES